MSKVTETISNTKIKKPKAYVEKEVSKKITWKEMVRQKELILLTIPFILYVLVFNYVPLFGWIMAFQNYKPAKGFFDQTWIGFAKFRQLFTNDVFLGVLRNTLAMSIINLVLGFVCSILLALLLNEVKSRFGKKVCTNRFIFTTLLIMGYRCRSCIPSTFNGFRYS
ncbi:hypothetical protein [Cellulosilyticum ruminicola]|uniref:hypothetical protein n=1 Tax=Cellulosilyticum ruminicola TaxID=425254 RepID=UPI000B1C6D44|nr:hypothetical protein [Cellulosilyticum ruminicola]